MEERIIKGRRDLWSIEDDVRMNCAKYLLLTYELPIPIPLYNGIGNKKKVIVGRALRFASVLIPKHYGVLDNSREKLVEYYETKPEALVNHKKYLEGIRHGATIWG